MVTKKKDSFCSMITSLSFSLSFSLILSYSLFLSLSLSPSGYLSVSLNLSLSLSNLSLSFSFQSLSFSLSSSSFLLCVFVPSLQLCLSRTSGVDIQQGGGCLDRRLTAFVSVSILCYFISQPSQNAKYWTNKDLGTDNKQYFGNFPVVLIQNIREWTSDYNRPTIWWVHGGRKCVTDTSIDIPKLLSSEAPNTDEKRQRKDGATQKLIGRENSTREQQF